MAQLPCRPQANGERGGGLYSDYGYCARTEAEIK